MKPESLRKIAHEERQALPEGDNFPRAPEHVFCPRCERELDPALAFCRVCKLSVAELDVGLDAPRVELATRASRATPDLRAMLSIVGLAYLVGHAVTHPSWLTTSSLLLAAMPWVIMGIKILHLRRLAGADRMVFATPAQRSPYHDFLMAYVTLTSFILVGACYAAVRDIEFAVLIPGALCGILSAVYLIVVVRSL